MAFPLYPLVLRLLRGRAPQQPIRVFWRLLIEDGKTAAAQVLLLLTFLAYHAYEMVHAIVLTLVRLIVTQRRLLEWETAAATAARSAGLAVRGGALLFFGEMAVSPLTALLLLFLVTGARPAALPVAAPILALWSAAPLVAWWLSRPVTPARHRLSAEDRLLLHGIARKTWRYFDTFMGAAITGFRRTTCRKRRTRSWRTGPRPPTSRWGSSPPSPPTTSATSAPRSCSTSSRPS